MNNKNITIYDIYINKYFLSKKRIILMKFADFFLMNNTQAVIIFAIIMKNIYKVHFHKTAIFFIGDDTGLTQKP